MDGLAMRAAKDLMTLSLNLPELLIPQTHKQ